MRICSSCTGSQPVALGAQGKHRGILGRTLDSLLGSRYRPQARRQPSGCLRELVDLDWCFSAFHLDGRQFVVSGFCIRKLSNNGIRCKYLSPKTLG